jgi:hypothetical protein
MLRLSGMISQYFFTAAICPMHRAVRLWLVFPVPADVRDMSESHDHPAAVFACRRFAPAPRSQAARSSRVRPPSAQLQNIAAAYCGQARAAHHVSPYLLIAVGVSIVLNTVQDLGPK